jgi:hypothetical protein
MIAIKKIHRNKIHSIKIITKIGHMKKIILSAAFVFLFTALKAQQAKVDNGTKPPKKTEKVVAEDKGKKPKSPSPVVSHTRSADSSAALVRTLLRKKPPENPRQKQTVDTSKKAIKTEKKN